MNKFLLKKILENKEKLIPLIFTKTQVSIIKKYSENKNLKKSEKTYFYSKIKKKIDALGFLTEEYHIKGREMISSRVKKAKEILRKTSKKAFISGSFLYSKNYNDIDFYIISKKRKQYHKDNIHFIFLTENDLKKPVYYSAYIFSISNFSEKKIIPEIKRPNFNDIVMAYELAINEILDNDDQKTLRDLIFEYHMQIKNKILDSCSLYKEFKKVKSLKKIKKIEFINKIIKELLLSKFSNNYLYNELISFVKELAQDIKDFKTNENLIIYHKTLGEIKDECKRAKS